MNAKILNWISAIVLIINMLILIGFNPFAFFRINLDNKILFVSLRWIIIAVLAYTTYRIVNRRVI